MSTVTIHKLFSINSDDYVGLLSSVITEMYLDYKFISQYFVKKENPK